MILQNHNADFYINKINNNEHFSFTRWGDGEWLCAVGKGLITALSNNNYYKAIWPTTHGQIQKNLKYIHKVLNDNNIKEIEWVNAIVWEDLVIREGIDKLKNALESRNFIIVSNPPKRNLGIKHIDFIEVPDVNCFLDKERIKKEMLEMSKKYDNCVFGISASMTTNVIVDELYNLIGKSSTMIDFGSIWDPFIGVRSRSYHDEYITKSLR